MSNLINKVNRLEEQLNTKQMLLDGQNAVVSTLKQRTETYQACLNTIKKSTDDKLVLALISQCEKDILYGIRRS